jgi:plastocyanin
MTSRSIARRFLLLAGAVSTLALAGCGGKEGDHDRGESRHEESKSEEHHDKPATGKVITVQVTTDEKGNYFSPAEIEAKEGDVLRFTLVTGVHNVHFLADSNAGKSGLPPASDMLQLPGQTYDVPLTFGEGTFYFQCDPHVALGMKGHVKVED